MKKILILTIAAMMLTAISLQAQPHDDANGDSRNWPMSPFWAQADDTIEPGHRQPGQFGRRGDRGPNFSVPERKHLEQFRMLKLLELLDLDSEQEMPFISAFNSLRKATRELEEGRRDLFRELATGIHDSTISDKEINQLYSQIERNELAMKSARGQFLDKARTTLSAYQFGKLIVFNERFELELLEKVREFHNRRSPAEQGKGKK